jgi:hypothetical protein
MLEKILRELESFQPTVEVLKSRGFSGSSCWLGVIDSFMWLDGTFIPWCCALMLDVGVDP